VLTSEVKIDVIVWLPESGLQTISA